MNRKAVLLLSGGLDSRLAIAIVKTQGVEVEALNFQTIFECCKDTSRQTAHEFGVRYHMLRVEDDYLKVIEKPKYGYGKGMNPCVDCRVYMFKMAKKFMEKLSASFIVSGEVLGQRPMSQKMHDFKRIEAESGLEGLILRPLSAKCLPETKPEKAGIVDRSKLYGIRGRSRQGLLRLAREYGIAEPPDASSGCALTEPLFSKKVRDLFQHNPNCQRWEFETLKVGRHFRLDPQARIIVGRDEKENALLDALHRPGTVYFESVNFAGPSVLLVGPDSTERVRTVMSVILRYAKKPLPDSCEIKVRQENQEQVLRAETPAREETVEGMRIV